ncbi:hypothetical protein A0128_06185 [Leptospira tipperaryensis]|uniref:Uncharacterized protein n=1 Tax=Leptospira tipperaryensis TaxID=2564040 RepID=A0A1D7UV99_9LEPT|nr:hypothetical protein A0128_06185 [Leptospira tipperaryensis]
MGFAFFPAQRVKKIGEGSDLRTARSLCGTQKKSNGLSIDDPFFKSAFSYKTQILVISSYLLDSESPKSDHFKGIPKIVLFYKFG